jgi:Tol biopolymer transport system component
MLARGETAKLVAAKGSGPALSHDGKRLLYTREDSANDHTVVLYDATTAKATDLIRGAQSAFWAPDDSQIAFLKSSGGGLQVWTSPAGAPDRAAQLASTPVLALHGWQDVHTVLATDASKLYFLKTESPPSSTDLRDIYGTTYQIAAADTLRSSPVNSDLLAVAASAGAVSNVFLYELKSKRRVPLTAANLNASAAEWSRDGIQVFFTARDAAKNVSVYRIFWDGSGLRRIRPGGNLVIGQ